MSIILDINDIVCFNRHEVKRYKLIIAALITNGLSKALRLCILFSITDDLERAMSKDKPYFILPARQAVDGCDHTFYFEVVGLFFLWLYLITLVIALCHIPICYYALDCAIYQFVSVSVHLS